MTSLLLSRFRSLALSIAVLIAIFPLTAHAQSVSARAATTAALPANTYFNGVAGVGATLTANSNGSLVVDGVNVTAGDNVLVKNEASGANDGVYTVTAAGTVGTPYILTRSTLSDTAAELLNQYVYITDGQVNYASGWYQISGPSITIGTTILVYSNPGIAGYGLVQAPNGSLSVLAADGTITVTSAGVAATVAAPSTYVLSDASTFSSGSAQSMLRSDSRGLAQTGLPSGLTPSSVQSQGTSTSLARADHVHAMTDVQARIDAGTFSPTIDAGTFAAPVDGGTFVQVSGIGSYATHAALEMPAHTFIQNTLSGDFLGSGYLVGITGSGGGSSGMDSFGVFRQNITSAVLNASQTQSSVTSDIIYQTDPVLVMKQAFQRTTTIRWFAGFAQTGCQPVTADDPANSAIGFQFSTARGDTSIQYMYDNGTTQTLAASGVTFTADIPLVFGIEYSSTGPAVTFVIMASGIKGGTSGAVLGTLSVAGAGLPVSTKTALICSGATTLAAATLYFRTYYWNITMRN